MRTPRRVSSPWAPRRRRGGGGGFVLLALALLLLARGQDVDVAAAGEVPLEVLRRTSWRGGGGGRRGETVDRTPRAKAPSRGRWCRGRAGRAPGRRSRRVRAGVRGRGVVRRCVRSSEPRATGAARNFAGAGQAAKFGRRLRDDVWGRHRRAQTSRAPALHRLRRRCLRPRTTTSQGGAPSRRRPGRPPRRGRGRAG